MLTVDAVSVGYGHVMAVRRASLEVRLGEIVALLGPNGAGKSSLLRAIAGLLRPLEGEIRWEGLRLDSLPAHRVAYAGLALVPEGRQVLPDMTVRDNLMVGGYVHHAGSIRDLLGPLGWVSHRPAVQTRLANVFGLFPQLQERQTQLAGSLSGGEQQMLAIGRAMMASPRLLLLDEPSIGLAPNLVREILALLVRLREGGLTVLLVEQDVHAALRIADRAYVMETGRIAVEGTAKELLSSAHMRRAYLGRA
jgi:branched-chain amino acid transport system ATP-binding protein